MPIKNQRFEKGAKVGLIITLVSILGNLASVIQTEYQLVSGLIPNKVIWLVIDSFLYMAIAATVLCLISLILFFYQKYIASVILCAIAIIGQQLYHLS